MTSEEKSHRKPVGLSSIINVVQHDTQPGQKSSQRKMELKSVVCFANDAARRTSSNGVKGHDPKNPKNLKASTDKPVLLLPFGHQVSGRASILCYDETTLLKPYVSRELFFYQSIPQDLKKFTPQFRGLVTVSFIEDSTTASVLAYALPRTLVKPNAKSILKLFTEEPKPHSKRCVKDYGKTHVIYPSKQDELATSLNLKEKEESLFVESCDFSPTVSKVQNVDKGSEDVVSELSQGFDVTVCIDEKKPSGKENQEQNLSATGLHNPWNSKVLDDAWLKLKCSDTDNPSNGKKKRFTLLENVVARYRRPCVLDLKIGTRVRENASPEKIARHVTAINLGARLSGMQIYHPEQEKFTYHNKYYGHNLTIMGFKSNLCHFFSRGTIPIKGFTDQNRPFLKSKRIDEKLVKEAIKKLSQLKDAIESMQSHRFYSSSVLLLYEGDVATEEEQDTEQDEAMNLFSDKPADEMDIAVSENQEDTATQEKVTPRSFSFSDFLQRIKQSHVKHHAKRSLSSHDGEFKMSNQKYMRGSEIYKHEKARHRNHKNGEHRAHKSHEHHHHGKHHRDLDSASSYPSQSWPPRAKYPLRMGSHKSQRNHEKHGRNCNNSDDMTKKESFEDVHSRSYSSRLCDHNKHRDDFDINKQDSRQHHGDSHESQKEKMLCDSLRSRDIIDVRMIDFAHYCFHDNDMHPGPDGGFLFGLDNLIKLLSEMLTL